MAIHSIDTLYVLAIAHLGWISCLVVLAGCFTAALQYTGKAGEKYSLLNHFISELGEKGYSKGAMAFNFPMILGGVCLIPFMFLLGFTLPSAWSKLGMAAGLVAAVSTSLVGIFSMDRLIPHRRAAMTFFRAGFWMMLLFLIAVFVQPEKSRTLPLVINIPAAIALMAYAIFLIIVSRKTDKHGNPNYILDPSAMPVRPRFWRTPFMEWMLFLFTLLWIISVSISLIFQISSGNL